MQDLSGKYPAALVPSSMSTGNTVAADPKLPMTAPGSDSVNKLPDKMDQLPMPRFTDGRVPVSNAPNKPRPQAAHPGGGSFAEPSHPGPWKDSEDNG